MFLDAGAIDEATLARLADTDGLTGLGSAWGAFGSPHVGDTLAIGEKRLTLRRHVQAFFQGNRYLLRDLVAHVAGLLPEGGAVLDLYAGVGLFSLAAAGARGASVVAVEGDFFAAADLQANAAAFGGAITTVRASVESIGPGLAGANRTFDAVIVDPPRTGMSTRGAGQRAEGQRAAAGLRIVRRRHPRARRAPHRRSRLHARARRRVRSVPEHAARRNGRCLRTMSPG